MALTNKKYEKFYKTDGSGNDKITSEKLTFAEDVWDLDRANGMKDHINNPDFAPLIFQLQQIQDELDYLRTEISANKDKTGISTSQASAITANTAKTGITLQEQKDISNNKAEIASNFNAIRSNAVDIANKLTVVPNLLAPANAIQELRVGVSYNLKTNTHELMFTYSETTPRATLRKSGSIQLK
tara:strand:+ start:19800 stop:20354 length:555 start_codon:yes stop_codon:yes gene_type:complete